MNLEDVPGVVAIEQAHGETTVVVERDALREAAAYLRDAAGFNFLSDVSATDYLGYGERGVSGYIATPAGRDLNTPMTQGLQVQPQARPKRFGVSYHLLALGPDARRLRLRVYADEGEPVASLIEIWPTADWHEREAYDLMGIAIAGHPNLRGSSPTTIGTATRCARTTRSAASRCVSRRRASGSRGAPLRARRSTRARASRGPSRRSCASPTRSPRAATCSRSTSGPTIPRPTACCG